MCVPVCVCISPQVCGHVHGCVWVVVDVCVVICPSVHAEDTEWVGALLCVRMLSACEFVNGCVMLSMCVC